jgi:sulfite exporter TauE/SafE
MSQGRILAIAFIAIGVILAAVSVLADVFLGARGTTFGWKQLLGLVAGIVLVVAGIILLRQGDAEYADDEEYVDEEETVAEEVAEGERRA